MQTSPFLKRLSLVPIYFRQIYVLKKCPYSTLCRLNRQSNSTKEKRAQKYSIKAGKRSQGSWLTAPYKVLYKITTTVIRTCSQALFHSFTTHLSRTNCTAARRRSRMRTGTTTAVAMPAGKRCVLQRLAQCVCLPESLKENVNQHSWAECANHIRFRTKQMIFTPIFYIRNHICTSRFDKISIENLLFNCRNAEMHPMQKKCVWKFYRNFKCPQVFPKRQLRHYESANICRYLTSDTQHLKTPNEQTQTFIYVRE